MTKRILLYGMAFGSLIALTTFIYFKNEMYNDFVGEMIVIRLVPIVLQVIGIWMVIKAVRRANGGYIHVGRAAFSGIMASVVMAVISNLYFYAYLQQQPDAIEKVKTAIKSRTIAFAERPENKGQVDSAGLADKFKSVDYTYTPKKQLQLNVSGILGVGLVIAISFGMMLQKNPPNHPNT